MLVLRKDQTAMPTKGLFAGNMTGPSLIIIYKYCNCDKRVESLHVFLIDN